MPLRNRVTPLGELIADPARGLVYGNRGCLHDDTGRIRRRYAGKRWIACRLGVPRLAPRAAAPAGEVHRALLPGRGDRLRRGTSAVRALPARGLRALRRALARASSRRGRCGRDRRAAPLRATHGRRAGAAPSRGAPGHSPGRRVRAARRCSVDRRRIRARALDSCRLRGPRDAAERARDRDHATLTRRDPAVGLGRLPASRSPDDAASCSLVHVARMSARTAIATTPATRAHRVKMPVS